MKQKSIILGILGGGQLGRMSALAAARLGIRTHIYCPESNTPAEQVTDLFTCANYEDYNKLKEFANSVDVISYEFENIPLETVEYLEALRPVYPDTKLLQISQNRLKEKAFLNNIGIETAPWAAAYKAQDIETTLNRWNVSDCIIKTTRFGYDGKGQIKLKDKNDILSSWNNLETEEAIIEGIIDFDYEVSCIVARDAFERSETFPLTLNDHKNHILSSSTVPAQIPANIEDAARAMTIRVAEAVSLRGVLALELFVTKEGKLIANEIAPRTHNSGHWTMDACSVSQFEQHVRAVCGLPIARPIQHSAVVMHNLIGDDIKQVPEYLRMDNACVHLYGKNEAREGRKMGHVNILSHLKK